MAAALAVLILIAILMTLFGGVVFHALTQRDSTQQMNVAANTRVYPYQRRNRKG